MDRHSPLNAAVLRHRRRQSPPLLNPVVLILLLPTLALILIFLLITSFISYTPNLKTKGLDYLNIILLLFAILCGLFPKRNASAATKSRPLESSQRYECPDPTAESGSPATGGYQLRRNSSYPDIRQMPDWETGYDQLRFFDDFELDKYKSYSRRSEAAEKVIPVDTFEAVRSLAADFPREIKHDQIRSEVKNVNRSDMKIKRKCKKKIRIIQEETENVVPPQKLFSPAPPPPPPPPPPPLSFYGIFKKGNKTKRVHSLSHSSPPPSSRSIFNDIFKSGSKSKRFLNQARSVPPPPPPPPPPPFSSIINNIFKTGSKNKRFNNRSKSPPTHPSSIFNDIKKFGSKSKRIHSLSRLVPPPPPPPPPPPSSILNNLFKSGSKSKRYQKKSPSAPRPPPPPPPPSSLFNNIFKSGSKSKRCIKKSPSAPPPAPPPPLPSSLFNNTFKTDSKSKRFSLASAPSPCRRLSGRPPLPAKTENLYGGGDQTPEMGAQSPERSEEMNGRDWPRSTVTCPSPDVNMKADSFIARLKGEWRLEKINSVREKMNMSPRSSPRA